MLKLASESLWAKKGLGYCHVWTCVCGSGPGIQSTEDAQHTPWRLGWDMSWEQECDSQRKEQSRGLSCSGRNIREYKQWNSALPLDFCVHVSDCHFWTYVSKLFLRQGWPAPFSLTAVRGGAGGGGTARLSNCKVWCHPPLQTKFYHCREKYKISDRIQGHKRGWLTSESTSQRKNLVRRDIYLKIQMLSRSTRYFGQALQ